MNPNRKMIEVKNLNGFVVGADFQVAYPKGGNTNILWNRLNGKILSIGTGRNGNRHWTLIKYRCHKTGQNRVARLSIAKMVNPVVFS